MRTFTRTHAVTHARMQRISVVNDEGESPKKKTKKWAPKPPKTHLKLRFEEEEARLASAERSTETKRQIRRRRQEREIEEAE